MKRQTKRERLIQQIADQQKWINDCEANGKSYTGPNGDKIRQADENYLKQLQTQLDGCRK